MDRVSLPLLYQLVTAQTTHAISSGCVDVPATPPDTTPLRVKNTILNESHFVHVDESLSSTWCGTSRGAFIKKDLPPPPPPPPPPQYLASEYVHMQAQVSSQTDHRYSMVIIEYGIYRIYYGAGYTGALHTKLSQMYFVRRTRSRGGNKLGIVHLHMMELYHSIYSYMVYDACIY